LVFFFDLSQLSKFEEIDHYFESFCDVRGSASKTIRNVTLLGNKADIDPPALSDEGFNGSLRNKGWRSTVRGL
jgi:hypothetical protein